VNIIGPVALLFSINGVSFPTVFLSRVLVSGVFMSVTRFFGQREVSDKVCLIGPARQESDGVAE